MLESHICAKRY